MSLNYILCHLPRKPAMHGEAVLNLRSMQYAQKPAVDAVVVGKRTQIATRGGKTDPEALRKA